jgi:hypothetical protein
MAGFSYYVSSPDGFRAARSDLLTTVTGLPAWGRFIVLVLALPGIFLIGLSLLALAASIATLLLLTVPAYALLRRLADWLRGTRRAEESRDLPGVPISRPARRVEATVIE